MKEKTTMRETYFAFQSHLELEVPQVLISTEETEKYDTESVAKLMRRGGKTISKAHPGEVNSWCLPLL